MGHPLRDSATGLEGEALRAWKTAYFSEFCSCTDPPLYAKTICSRPSELGKGSQDELPSFTAFLFLGLRDLEATEGLTTGTGADNPVIRARPSLITVGGTRLEAREQHKGSFPVVFVTFFTEFVIGRQTTAFVADNKYVLGLRYAVFYTKHPSHGRHER